MPFEMKERIALVTGANRGIGEAFVHYLVSKGAKKVYACGTLITCSHWSNNTQEWSNLCNWT